MGDIHGFDYVFLGNYVDRGAYSLETICLLMSLKLKYPKQIFLLRGNHEDKNVNRYLGFGEECAKRLDEDITQPNSVFAKINEMFDYLPLAAIVSEKSSQNKVFCVHGGIGTTVNKIEDIEKIQRPISVNLGDITTTEQQLLVDLLWSDPVDPDEENTVQEQAPNVNRDPMNVNNITKFGVARVEKFLKFNGLSMILRSHQICSEGLDRFAQGQLITINSCTDYCGKYNNDACFIVVQKKIIVSPKIIKPAAQSKANWLENQSSGIPETANSSVRRGLTPPRVSRAIVQ
jgi:diadenosine tetraphosphatase ApaH/serine/threonine PP2A family protein phosphatase